MTFPILPTHELGLVFAVFSGFGFGFVLERAGFGRAQKLVGQFYGYDMSVFKVMFSAVVTAMLVIVVASVLGLTDFKLIADHATSSTLLLPMFAGGMLLGMGFIMSGYCPGTSYVAMASGKIDGLFTVIGTMIGLVIWSELEWRPAIAKFHNSTDLGNYYLWELFHLPAKSGPAIVAVAVAAMAIGCFIGAEKIEKTLASRADPLAVATPGGRPRRFVFAGFAAAALAGLAGLALPSGTQARTREPAVIGQLDLARRVFDEPWKLRIIDLRPMKDCAAKRIPGAECVPSDKLAGLNLTDANPARDLVLVGENDLAQVPLPAAAYPGRVYSLAGGWKGWEVFALAPPAPPAPGAAEADVELYRLRAGIQSAITGMKAAPPPPTPSAAASGAPRKGGGGCSG